MGTKVLEAAKAYLANKPEGDNIIAQDAFVEMVKAGEDMVILDIRGAQAYAKGHVKGAVNLPWGRAISDGLSRIPKGKTVYIYCVTGQTAGQAVATFAIAGFDVRTVKFGWNLGISKVPGVEAITETAENTLAGSSTIDPDIQEALDKYYQGLADVAGTTYENYKISEAKAKELLDAGDDSVVFLDVRKAADYAAGHVANAINIPFAVGMEKSFDTLPKDKTIIVYCYTGQTAGQVVAVLRLMGYDAVSMNGGTGMPPNAPAGWINQGYPVVAV